MIDNRIERALILEDTAIFQPYQLSSMATIIAEADDINNSSIFGTAATSSKWQLLFFGTNARAGAYKVLICISEHNLLVFIREKPLRI